MNVNALQQAQPVLTAMGGQITYLGGLMPAIAAQMQQGQAGVPQQLQQIQNTLGQVQQAQGQMQQGQMQMQQTLDRVLLQLAEQGRATARIVNGTQAYNENLMPLPTVSSSLQLWPQHCCSWELRC